MIAIDLIDVLVWGVGLAIIMIGCIRLLSAIVKKMTANRQSKDILFCNVCVKYFVDKSDEKHAECPTCGRASRRGRNRNLG